MKTKTTFQSYLILGSQDQTDKDFDALAQELGVKIASNSPDIYIVKPLVKSQNSLPQTGRHASISIDQIRDAKRLIFQKPISAKFKITIIKSAQNMTTEAQNALLKILEEPPAHAIIILTSTQKAGLLPTILSRVKIIATKPQKHQSKEPVDLDDPDIASLLEEVAGVEDPLSWLDEQIVAQHDLLKKNISGNQQAISSAKISDTIEKCIDAKKMIEANVNPKFVLFNLIISLNPKI